MKSKIVGYILALVTLVELVSFAVYAQPSLRTLVSAGIFFAIVACALWRYEYILYAAVAELMIGSKGYLFWATIGSFQISLRMALFCAVLAGWLWNLNRTRQLPRIFSPGFRTLTIAWLCALAAVAWGMFRGYVSGYSFQSIYFDANGYFYLLLLPAVLDAWKTTKSLTMLLYVWAACGIYVAVKSLALLYIYTHTSWFAPVITYVYKWVRDTGVGEITWAGGGLWRIFFQSHIYSLAGLALFFLITLGALREAGSIKKLLQSAYYRWYAVTILACMSAVLVSFSRSYWIGLLAGIAVVFLYILMTRMRALKAFVTLGALTAVFGIAVIFIVSYFPVPKPTSGYALDALRARFTLNEPAASSRWNLLKPLEHKISEAPFFGSGFGTTVTFQTEDPRIKNADNPEGWNTTASFEWGYLDTVTEMGIVGLLAQLVFVWAILTSLLQAHRAAGAAVRMVYDGIAVAIFMLLITHIFSPYLNHPLGIGILLIAASCACMDVPDTIEVAMVTEEILVI